MAMDGKSLIVPTLYVVSYSVTLRKDSVRNGIADSCGSGGTGGSQVISCCDR